MLPYFSRSLRTIEADTTRRSVIVFAMVLFFLALWGCWFALGHVGIYAASSSARLEVDREHHPVETVVGGRIVAVHVAAGQAVKAGDVLLELDAKSERFAR